VSMGDAHSPTRLSRPLRGRFATAKQKVRTDMDCLINEGICGIIILVNDIIILVNEVKRSDMCL
jgi:hypothetical protein